MTINRCQNCKKPVLDKTIACPHCDFATANVSAQAVSKVAYSREPFDSFFVLSGWLMAIAINLFIVGLIVVNFNFRGWSGWSVGFYVGGFRFWMMFTIMFTIEILLLLMLTRRQCTSFIANASAMIVITYILLSFYVMLESVLDTPLDSNRSPPTSFKVLLLIISTIPLIFLRFKIRALDFVANSKWVRRLAYPVAAIFITLVFIRMIS